MMTSSRNKRSWLLAGLCSLVLVACPSPDAQPPKVALSPSSTSIDSSNNPLVLTAVASDNIGVQKVEFFDGTTLLGSKDSEPYTLEVALTAAQDGTRQYKAKAYDLANNSAESGVVSVAVKLTPVPDTQAPTIALTASSATVRATNSLTLTAVAVDNIGVAKVEFFDGTTLLGTKTSAPYTWALTFDASQNGARSFSAKAFDAANNVTTSETVPVTIDLTAATAIDASILSGTVPAWLRGQRNIKMLNPSNGGMLTQGVIDPTGSLNGILPDLVENGVVLTGIAQSIASGCNTAIITPTDAKGLTLATPIVYKTPQNPTGTLVFSNEAGFSSPQAVGSKVVIRIFADKNATVTGTCTLNPFSLEYNLTLNRGWNIAIFETISATSIRVTTGAIPTDVSWRYMPNTFKSVQILNKPTRLEIGKATILETLIKDSEGFAVTDMQPNWSIISFDPTVAVITPQGVITAQKFANFSVNASLSGSGSDSFNVNTFGLQVIGGTLAVDGQTQFGSAFAAKMLVPNANNTNFVAPSSSGTVEIRGPAGWNGGQALTFAYGANASFAWDARNTAFVAGNYSATATFGATTYQSSFSVAAGTPALTTTNVEVKDRSPSAVKLTWGPPSCCGGNEFGLWEGRLFSGSTLVSTVRTGTGFPNSLDFTGLSLSQSSAYQAVLYRLPPNIDFQFPTEFNISSVSRNFDLRPVVTSLSFNAVSANVSGVLLTINGQGFTNDSTVQFGNISAGSTSVVSSSQIDVIIPAGGSGTVDVIVTTAAGASSASAASKFKFYGGAEYSVVSGFSSVSKIATDPNGTAWFVNTSSFPAQLVNINSSGALTSYSINNCSNLFGITDIEVAANGTVWIAGGSFGSGLCRFSAGTFTSFTLPAPQFSSSSAGAIAIDANGDVWFQYSGQSKMGKLVPSTGAVTDYPLPTTSTFSSGGDVIVAGDGNIWFSGFSTFGGQLGKLQPSTGTINMYSLIPNAQLVNFTEQNNLLWFLSRGKLYSSTYAGIPQETTINNLPPNFFATAIQASANDLWSFSNLQLVRMNPTTNQAENIVVATSSNFSSGLSSISVKGDKVWFSYGGKIGYITF